MNTIEGTPKWYRNLYKDYAKEHPNDADMEILAKINEVEES